MRKQQQIWLAEYTQQASMPSMNSTEPASGVTMFIDYLKEVGTQLSKAVDIGAGRGRNTVYMAEQGIEVYALEYIEPALATIRTLADSRGVSDKIHFELSEIDTKWQYEDNFFDIAIDSFSSIDIETKAGRETCRDEMFRTLKSGGYAMVMVVASDDEWEAEFIASNPGPEPSSTLWPETGKFQKDYDEAELRTFYGGFEILELRKVTKPAFKLGRQGMATNFWLVMRKP